MCTQLANVPMTVLQGVASMQAQQRQDQARQAEADYQASLKTNQAAELRNEATETRAEAQRREEDLRRAASIAEGKTRSMLSASGVLMNSGSSVDLINENTNQLNRQLSDVNREAAKAESQYLYKADMNDYAASHLQNQAKYAKASDFERGLNTANLAIGTASNIYNAYKSLGGSNSLL